MWLFHCPKEPGDVDRESLWMGIEALRLSIVKWERADTEYELVLEGVVLESVGKGRTVGKKEGGR